MRELDQNKKRNAYPHLLNAAGMNNGANHAGIIGRVAQCTRQSVLHVNQCASVGVFWLHPVLPEADTVELCSQKRRLSNKICLLLQHKNDPMQNVVKQKPESPYPWSCVHFQSVLSHSGQEMFCAVAYICSTTCQLGRAILSMH